MDTQPSFGLKDLLAHIVGDIVKAVAERPGESREQRFVRTQAAAFAVMTFVPTDAIEAMIAGHCVMFHELIVDSVHGTMGSEPQASRRADRAAIVAMDRAFGANLTRLERYRKRQAEAAAGAQPDVATKAPEPNIAETEIADRVHRHQSPANTPAAGPRTPPAPETTSTILSYPSSDKAAPLHPGPGNGLTRPPAAAFGATR